MSKTRIKNFFHYNWHFGDRYDGWRVRKMDTVFRVIPYFLRTRIDAQNFFEERVPIDYIETFIKDHKEEMPDLSIMHIVLASLVRIISQRPHLNRFVVWNKLFARNHLNIALVVKRSLTDEGEETLIKPEFALEDTLQDVVRKVREELDKNQKTGQQNGSDKVSKYLGLLPDFLLRTVVFFLYWTDKVGLLPKLIYRVSPWHSSVFLTNIGSIGVESIYHHLYEFGTCSMFVAMGKKSRANLLDPDGEINTTKSIMLKFVLDERICDGFYYASSMRMLNKILADPSVLLVPPQTVVIDTGVGRKPADI
ncbi:MAG: 2-oxo acid dehydrogenase subunit E2 [Prevotellaceae bacterium]|jgi:hypothetical protein|nr:2-oxo acid dehydrogenase subunit E2 [Prevotellaceae bacterium]